MPAGIYGTPEQWYLLTTETEDGMRSPALGPYPLRGGIRALFYVERCARGIHTVERRGVRLGGEGGAVGGETIAKSAAKRFG